jgi:hypothetical protein
MKMTAGTACPDQLSALELLLQDMVRNYQGRYAASHLSRLARISSL